MLKNFALQVTTFLELQSTHPPRSHRMKVASYSAILWALTACSGTPSGGGTIVSGGSASPGGSNPIATGGNATGGPANGGTLATGGKPTGGSTTGGTSTAGTQTSLAATIVPLYSYPTESPWPGIVAAKLAHPAVPVIAIVNVNDGPGTAVDSEFTTGIRALTNAGILVIGYVYTSYAARSATAVKADIDAWHAFYPGVTGIFFDEESNVTGQDTYYRDLANYAKGIGMAFTVANPGTDTSAAYVNAMDVTFIYESDGLPSSSNLTKWRSNYARSKVGVIPYAISFDAAWVQQARTAVQYIYVTNDDLPNPWDTLPSYFTNLLAALE